MSRRVFFIIVIVALMFSLLPVNVSALAGDPEAMIAVVDRYTHDLWGDWQFDIADEILAENFVAHVWMMPDMDWETYLETIIEPISTQQEFSLDYLALFVEGDYAVGIGNWGGTVYEEEGDVPVIDNYLRVNGVDIYRIEDGKISEVWILYDTMSYLQQLGIVPAEGDVMADQPWDIALGESSTTPEENKALLAKLFQNVADHDMDAYFANFTEDSIVHDQHDDMTREEAKETMIGIQTAWPDHHPADAMYFAGGDLTVAMYTLVFAEDEVMFGGVNVNRFENGKVAEEWWLYDAYTLTQLLTPPAEE